MSVPQRLASHAFHRSFRQTCFFQPQTYEVGTSRNFSLSVGPRNALNPSQPRANLSRIRQRCLQTWRSRPQSARAIRQNSSTPRPHPTQHLNSPPAKLSLRDQLKRLTKEYGRGAVLVYLLFSVADLPIAFGIVQLFGPERVGAAEHAVLGYIKSAWHSVVDPLKGQAVDMHLVSAESDVESATVREGIIGDEAIHTAAKARDGQATIWTQLALAYAIHKTLFIFVRIPLTVAFTPSIVKWMRARGGYLEWIVGKKKVA